MPFLAPPVGQLPWQNPLPTPTTLLPISTSATTHPTSGLIGLRNLQPRSLVTGNTSCTYRLRYPVTRTATKIRMTFPAWATVTAGVGDVPTGNLVTLAAVYAEYGGTLYPVTFNGASSYVIDSGGAVTSDIVSGLTVASGTNLYIRTYVTVPSGGSWPGLYGSFTFPDEVSRPNANLANATGDLTGTGQSVADLYGPLRVFGEYALGQKFNSVTICGDSIAAGTNDSFSSEANVGYYQRALWAAGDRPFSIVALPGENGTQLLAQGPNRADIVGEYVDYVINEYGINDLQSGATLAQLQARSFANTVITRNPWVNGRYQQTLGPKSSSTDGFATATNQTTDGINAARVQFNDWVRDGMPEIGQTAVATGTVGAIRAGEGGHPYTGYLEVADLCESARNSGIWKANYTSDGLHPNVTGNAAIAAALDLSFLVDTFPTTAPPTALVHDASSPGISSSAFQGSAASQAYTSPSFSPPAGSVIVVGAQATESFNNAWNTPTITDSLGSHLTWTLVTQQADVTFGGADTSAALFWAYTASAPGTMTVTVTQSLAGGGQTVTFSSLAVDVWTGVDTTAPIGNTAKGILTANALPVSLTPAGSNSALLLLANNAAAASGASSAGTGEYMFEETHVGTSFCQAWYGTAAGPTTPATAQTLDLNGATARWQYIAYELKGAPTSTPQPASVTVPAGQITATGTAPAVSVGVGQTLAVPAGQITYTGTAPTVSAAASASVSVPPGQVSLTGSAPSVSVGIGQTVAVPAGQIAISATPPGVQVGVGRTLSVPAGQLAASSAAPAVSVGTGVTITVPAGGATIAGIASVVSAAATVAVPAGSSTITGTAPTVTAGGGIAIAVPGGSLTHSGTAPAVSVGSGVTLAVPAGQLTATGTVPAVAVGVGVTLAIPPGQLSIAGTSPIVTVGGAFNTAVPAGRLAAIGTAPTVAATAAVSAPAGLIALTGTAPLVTITGGANVAVPAGRVTILATGPSVGTGVAVGVPAGAVAIAGTRPVVVIGTPINRDLMLTFALEPQRWTLAAQPARYTLRTEAT